MTGAVSWGFRDGWTWGAGKGSDGPFLRQLRQGGQACSGLSEEGLLAVEAVELPWRVLSGLCER